VTLVFAGLKAQVLEVMERTGLDKVIGKENIFRSTDASVAAVQARVATDKEEGEAREVSPGIGWVNLGLPPRLPARLEPTG
jgi:sulfate permease, SulP family